jgi:light-regulated signal transduction histidine kinase (bacteriophytochrome)
LDQLRRRSPSLPVVMLSGFADQAIAERARAGGAAAYLQKDTGLGQLAETVRRVTRDSVVEPPLGDADAAAPEPAALAEPAAYLPAAQEELLAELRRLEYVISHDFAEPARIVSGFANLLTTRYADELGDSGRLFCEHLVGAASRMQAMIDDLVAYARAGRSTPVIDIVDLNDLVAQLYRELRPADVVTELSAAALPAVRADRPMMQIILRHVLQNALMFNTAAIPTVRVTGETRDGLVVLSIADNGIGVHPAQQEAVFELFRRLNTREEYAGTGTGLALCRRLVTLQGGSIDLGSGSGGGTTVTLRLPGAAPAPRGTP